MSQLIINRLLKPSLCKNVFRHNKKVRMFCSKPTHPYMLINRLLNAHNEYKSKLVIKDKGHQEDVRKAMTVGFSDQDGRRVELEKSEDRDSTRLMLVNNTTSDDSDSEPMKHHLPPLPSGSRIHNVAMSNDPDVEKKDLVVAVKFLGSHVSLCKPFSDSGSDWIDIDTSGSVHPFSSLMYSKTEKKFLTVSFSGEYIWSLDIDFKEKDDAHPELEYMYYKEDPLHKIFPYLLKTSIWCSRTDHLVESPSGQHFLVKWFREDDVRDDEHKMVETITQKTVDFLVFRFDKLDDDLIYTEDIGDLCIFLGHSQAFCVQASSSPGLKPNSIYYVGSSFGVHDIAIRLHNTTFHTEDGVPLRSTEFPYWPPTLSY